MDVNGNTAVSHHYHRPAQGSIPLLDESSFQVSGNPLAPTISWSTVSGYPSHLYYRVRINDRQGNMVYHTPQPFPPDSYQVVPSGKLVAGAVYRFRVEAYDSPYFQAFDNRSNSSFRPLMVDVDEDGMDDGWEINYFGSLSRSGSGDLDGDGLTDLQEFQYGTNPTLTDTDGDGYTDGNEVGQGSDPLSSGSTPPTPGDPLFRYCTVQAQNTPDGIRTLINAQVYDPGGSLPGSITTLVVTGPGGFTYNFIPQNYSGSNNYGVGFPGYTPPEGEFTFQVTDSEKKTATTTYYHHAGPVIPLADTQSFLATGAALTPTLSWSAINGYEGNLFYRAEVLLGNTTVWTSGFTPGTFVNVPASANLQAGYAYQWRVGAFDNFRFEVSDHRSVSASVPLSVGSDTRPYFKYATIMNRHRPDGLFTWPDVTVADPNGVVPGSLGSLTVELVKPHGQPPLVTPLLIWAFNLLPLNQGGDYDPVWGSFSHRIPGRPADGIYRFTVVDNEGKQAVTYDYLRSSDENLVAYDIPLVASSTMNASGNPYDPLNPSLTFSWGAPAGMDRPLYYHTMFSEVDAQGNEIQELWRSSIIVSTMVSVPTQNLLQIQMQPTKSYQWKVRAYESKYFIHYNRSDSEWIPLVIDNSRPHVQNASAYHCRRASSYDTDLSVYGVEDPTGVVPDSIASVTVAGPAGSNYTYGFRLEDYFPNSGGFGFGEYWYAAPSSLPAGVYTFTVTNTQGETAETHDYLGAAQDIAYPDESRLKVYPSGDLAANWNVAASWSAIAGHPDHLFYRLRVRDSEGNYLYTPSRDPLTAATVSSSALSVPSSPCEMEPRRSYFFRIEATDGPDGVVYDNRSQTRWLPLLPQLDLASTGSAPGATVRLPITLRNAPGLVVTSTSNDIRFDTLRLVNPRAEIGPSATAAGKGMSVETAVGGDPGRIRITLSGNGDAPMGDGTVATVVFDVVQNAPLLGHTVLRNCPSAATLAARPVYAGGDWGKVSIAPVSAGCFWAAAPYGGFLLDYPTVQGALDAAVVGDTVLVAPGVHRVNGLKFNGKAIHLNCDGTPGSCILDGGGTGRVFRLEEGETGSSVICGFTIQNGLGDYGGGNPPQWRVADFRKLHHHRQRCTQRGGRHFLRGGCFPGLQGVHHHGQQSVIRRGGLLQCFESLLQPVQPAWKHGNHRHRTRRGGLCEGFGIAELRELPHDGQPGGNDRRGRRDGGSHPRRERDASPSPTARLRATRPWASALSVVLFPSARGFSPSPTPSSGATSRMGWPTRCTAPSPSRIRMCRVDTRGLETSTRTPSSWTLPWDPISSSRDPPPSTAVMSTRREESARRTSWATPESPEPTWTWASSRPWGNATRIPTGTATGPGSQCLHMGLAQRDTS